MINTSRAYKKMITGDEGSREFGIFDRITFSDGIFIDLSMDDVFSYSINDATTESGKFQVGAAIIKEYSVTLNNFDGKFDRYKFEGADIVSNVGLKLPDGTWEILKKGVFRVVKAVGVETIKLTAYDSMLFFDRPYSESSMGYPATLTQIIQNACVCCQMTFDASTIQFGNYVVQTRPADEALTFRDMISYAAQIMGCYARIDRLDRLQFGWYLFADDVNIWGGIFDKDMPYSTGSSFDGGSFNPWNNGDVYSSSLASMSQIHHLYDLRSKNINTEDIVITGVQVYGQKESNAEVPMTRYGEDGYTIVIENNPLIQSASDTRAIAWHVGAKLRYSCFRPMNISVQSDPAMEAGDSAIVTYSEKFPSVYTIITNTTFSVGNAQNVICSAEAPTEKNYKKYSAQTRILAKTKQESHQQMSVYEVIMQQMNQLAANTMGFFATTVPQADGSVIAYRHDKPKLEDSKIVYKSGIDGFWVTSDFRRTDAATSAAGKWQAGFDSNGNAVLNLLSVIGINFDWAHGGTLTLGGNGNGNGRLEIRNKTGLLIGYIDNTGVHFDEGSFKGTLSGGLITGSTILSQNNGYDIALVNGKLTLFWNYSRGAAAGHMYPKMSTAHIGSNLNAQIPVMAIQSDSSAGIEFLSGSKKMLQMFDGSSSGMGVNRTATHILSDDLEVFGSPSFYKPIDAQGGIVVENDLVVYGMESRLSKTDYYGERLQYSYGMASPMFGDIGEGITDQNGECVIDIDDIFSETVTTNIEYQVFLQKEGAGDIWVAEKTPTYFIAKGTPNLKFAWEIKVIQKDYEFEHLEEFTEEPQSIDDEIEDMENSYIEEMEQFINKQESLYETTEIIYDDERIGNEQNNGYLR